MPEAVGSFSPFLASSSFLAFFRLKSPFSFKRVREQLDTVSIAQYWWRFAESDNSVIMYLGQLVPFLSCTLVYPFLSPPSIFFLFIQVLLITSQPLPLAAPGCD